MKIKTLLRVSPEAILEVSEESFGSYQSSMNLIQRAIIQLVLSKDISSAILMGVYEKEKCISLKIFGRFDLPKFTLNIYLFQLVTVCQNKAVDLLEMSIGRFDENEVIVRLIKDAIISMTSNLSKGLHSEKLILDVLGEMKKEKRILSFRKSSSIDDLMGIDYFFCMRDYRNKEEDIPLQVKSSFSAQKHHREKFSKTPSLVVSSNTLLGDLKKNIIKIGEAYTAYRKNILHL
jgi:hypothetical protein